MLRAMPPTAQVCALAIAAIYLMWRDSYAARLAGERLRRQLLHLERLRRDRILRARVAALLWTAAGHAR